MSRIAPLYMLMLCLSKALVPSLGAQPALEAWQNVNKELGVFWREYQTAAETNNGFLEKNRLQKIQQALDFHQFENSPSISLGVLKSRAMHSVPEQPYEWARNNSPSSNHVELYLCTASISLEALKQCFTALSKDFKDPIQQWWLAAKVGPAMFYASLLSLTALLLILYLRHYLFIVQRWGLVFPGLHAWQAYVLELFTAGLCFLIGGPLGLLFLFWIGTVWVISAEKLSCVRWLSLLCLLAPAFLIPTAIYLESTRHFYPYDRVFTGLETKHQLSSIQQDQSQNKVQKNARHFILANSAMRFQNWSEAKKELDTFLQSEPENVEALMNRSLILLLEGQYEKGLSQLSQLEKKHPKHALLHFNLSKLNFALANLEQAQHHRNRAKTLDATSYFKWEQKSKKPLSTRPYIPADLSPSDLAGSFPIQAWFHSVGYYLKIQFPSFAGYFYWFVFLLMFLTSWWIRPYLLSEQEQQQNQATDDDLSFQEIIERSQNAWGFVPKVLRLVFPGFNAFQKQRFFKAMLLWFVIFALVSPFLGLYSSLVHPHAPFQSVLWPLFGLHMLSLLSIFGFNFIFSFSEEAWL